MRKLAIIIITYNGLNDTLECIESINKSSGNIDYQIIVVDNNSKINEASIIKERYPDIHTIRSKINGGFSCGNNLGIQYAIENDFEYCMLLNNDTFVDGSMIQLLLSRANDNTIVVPTMYYANDPKTIWYGGGYINKWTGKAEHKRMNLNADVDVLQEEDCSFATGCCVLVNTNIFKNIGLLDEKMFMYCEDTEFCIRALNNGVSIRYIPKAKLWHKVSKSTGGSASPFSIYYMTRNRLFCIKNYCDFFRKTAFLFTIITRYIRIMTEKDEKVKKAYRKAINDFQHDIYGNSFSL